MNESWVVFPKSGNRYYSDVGHADAAMDMVRKEFPASVLEVQRVAASGIPSYPFDFALSQGAVKFYLCFGTANKPDDQEAYVEFDVDPGKEWLIKTLQSFGVKRNWFIRVANKRSSFDNTLFSDYCRETLADVLPHEFMGPEYVDAPARKLANQPILARHDARQDRWPGKEKNVSYWYELEKYIVGFNENPSRGWSFPVKKRVTK